jgi:hypothetical protein
MFGSCRRGSVVLGTLSASLLFVVVPSGSHAATWKTQELPFQPRYPGDQEAGALLSISCPSASFCAAAGEYERIAVSTNPTGGPSAWNVFRGPEGTDLTGPPPPPGAPPNMPMPHIKGIACPAPGLCVAVSANGDIYTSESPLGGTAAWTRTDIDGDDYDTHLEAVSCPTPTFCVAVSGGAKSHGNPRTSGSVLYSHDPTGGPAAWHETQLDPEFDLRGLSCASPSLCLAVGQDGLMLVSTDPDGGSAAWQNLGAPAGPGHLQGVDCVPGLCIAGNTGGNLLTDVDPVGTPRAWTERSGGASVGITGISCPAANRCLAVDNNGDVITSTNPTGGGRCVADRKRHSLRAQTRIRADPERDVRRLMPFAELLCHSRRRRRDPDKHRPLRRTPGARVGPPRAAAGEAASDGHRPGRPRWSGPHRQGEAAGAVPLLFEGAAPEVRLSARRRSVALVQVPPSLLGDTWGPRLPGSGNRLHRAQGADRQGSLPHPHDRRQMPLSKRWLTSRAYP